MIPQADEKIKTELSESKGKKIMESITRGGITFKYDMLDMEELSDLNMLKTHLMYSDDFEELPKDRQKEIYNWCRLHATHPVVLKNLEQIRYAVTRIYFK